MALHTRVLVNIKKRKKQALILRCTFLNKYLDLNKPTTPSNLSKMIWDIKIIQILTEKHAPPFRQFFLFASYLKKRLSLGRSLAF